MSRRLSRAGTPEREEREPWVAALDAQIASEDREDARLEALQVRVGVPEPPRDLRTEPHWADGGVAFGRQER